MVSNQFVELKGSVFKKFDVKNVFQMSCSGEFDSTTFYQPALGPFLYALGWLKFADDHYTW